MSQESITTSVIDFLERKDFIYVECLGEGAYGSVIAVITPEVEKVAVKIVHKSKICKIEDTYWPVLHHANILRVTNTITIDELNVKLYFMPILPEVLDFTVYGDEFKRDPNGLNRVKKWFREILTGIEYLHSSGFCHLDIKTDNVLLDEDDNAVLCDFSGLNFTNVPLNSVVAPPVFWPKECFPEEGAMEIRGQSFDLWSFGLLVLNVLTDHYPQIKLNDIGKIKPDWEKEVWPILEKASTEAIFKHQMRSAFPNASFPESDIFQALHFVKFIMKIEPEERPSVSRIKMHPFLKTYSNPFLKEWDDYLRKEFDCVNPFVRNANSSCPNNQGDVEKSEIATDLVNRQKAFDSEDKSGDTKPPSHLQHQMAVGDGICCSPLSDDPKSHGDVEEPKMATENRSKVVDSENDSNDTPSSFEHQMIGESSACGLTSCDAPNSSEKSVRKTKTFRENVYNWFRKQFNRAFKRKKN